MSAPVSDIVGLADKWGAAIAEAIGKYGPDAARLAETVARLDAAKDVAQAVFGALTFGAIAYFCYRAARRHIAETKARRGERYEFFDCEPMIIVPIPIIGAGAGVVAMVCAEKLFNPILWFGLLEPKVWIVAKLLKL